MARFQQPTPQSIAGVSPYAATTDQPSAVGGTSSGGTTTGGETPAGGQQQAIAPFNNLSALGTAAQQRANNQLGAAQMGNQFAQGFNNSNIAGFNAQSGNDLARWQAQTNANLSGQGMGLQQQGLDLQKQNQLLNLFSNMLNTTASLA